jgi:hypothetical protein
MAVFVDSIELLSERSTYSIQDVRKALGESQFKINWLSTLLLNTQSL